MRKMLSCAVTLVAAVLLAITVHAEEYEYLNEQVLKFAEDRMGKTIGRGECWDLAAEPLKALAATWDGGYGFGRRVARGDSSGLRIENGEALKPGDIVQFTSVRTSWEKKYPDGRRAYGWETIGAPGHTAIVKAFDGKSVLTLIHQNVSGKRYLVETSTDLANVKSGTYVIYRPYRVVKKTEPGM